MICLRPVGSSVWLSSLKTESASSRVFIIIKNLE